MQQVGSQKESIGKLNIYTLNDFICMEDLSAKLVAYIYYNDIHHIVSDYITIIF